MHFEHLLTVTNRFVQIFEGNINRNLHLNVLKPPIVVEQIRIYPEVYKRKQVCLRFELLGCPLKYGELILPSLATSCQSAWQEHVLLANRKLKFWQSNFKVYPPTWERFEAPPQTLEGRGAKSVTRTGILSFMKIRIKEIIRRISVGYLLWYFTICRGIKDKKFSPHHVCAVFGRRSLWIDSEV